MPELTDGGPAYPSTDQHGGGMSLRDYFAAHAPAEPQSWFEPVMYEMPKPPYRAIDPHWGFSREQQDQAGSWVRDAHYDIDTEENSPFTEFCQAWRSHWDEIGEWEREYSKQLKIQWPFAWADALIAARNPAIMPP